jgi:thioredoxin-dependent peroxiredoxin
MLEVGTKAPKFSLENQSKETVNLDQYKGKWVVLYFYPRDNTSGCTKEAVDFTFYKKEFEDLGATILGVSPDSIEAHVKFITKQDLGITLLSDPEKEVMKAYGAWGLKKNYGKEYEGVIRSTFIIDPKQTIGGAWSKVKVQVKRKAGIVKHVEKVLEKLKELQS